MTASRFDAPIDWFQLEGFDHVAYHVLNVDETNAVVDVLFKFSAGERIVPHRHCADYSTFILQGELRIHDLAGELIETRPTGCFVASRAGGVHTEGGGDIDCIALFSNRGQRGVIYEVLGPDGGVVATLGFDDFKALHAAQPASLATA